MVLYLWHNLLPFHRKQFRNTCVTGRFIRIGICTIQISDHKSTANISESQHMNIHNSYRLLFICWCALFVFHVLCMGKVLSLIWYFVTFEKDFRFTSKLHVSSRIRLPYIKFSLDVHSCRRQWDAFLEKCGFQMQSLCSRCWQDATHVMKLCKRMQDTC